MPAQATILIVDDERDLVDAYVRLLERAGHRCFGAFDAGEAIQLIDAESPDLVITDLSLPDTSGIEVVRHIRSKSKDTPVIVMSGHNTPELNQAAHAAGASMSLLKPVSIAVLRRVIAEALGGKLRAQIKN
jgi:two-component system response regulator PilR (NtrC family)